MAKQIRKVKKMRVKWEIDIDAESHEDAARKALAILHDPRYKTSSTFDVSYQDGEYQQRIDINACDRRREFREATKGVRAYLVVAACNLLQRRLRYSSENTKNTMMKEWACGYLDNVPILELKDALLSVKKGHRNVS